MTFSVSEAVSIEWSMRLAADEEESSESSSAGCGSTDWPVCWEAKDLEATCTPIIQRVEVLGFVR